MSPQGSWALSFPTWCLPPVALSLRRLDGRIPQGQPHIPVVLQGSAALTADTGDTSAVTRQHLAALCTDTLLQSNIPPSSLDTRPGRLSCVLGEGTAQLPVG